MQEVCFLRERKLVRLSFFPRATMLLRYTMILVALQTQIETPFALYSVLSIVILTSCLARVYRCLVESGLQSGPSGAGATSRTTAAAGTSAMTAPVADVGAGVARDVKGGAVKLSPGKVADAAAASTATGDKSCAVN